MINPVDYGLTEMRWQSRSTRYESLYQYMTMILTSNSLYALVPEAFRQNSEQPCLTQFREKLKGDSLTEKYDL